MSRFTVKPATFVGNEEYVGLQFELSVETEKGPAVGFAVIDLSLLAANAKGLSHFHRFLAAELQTTVDQLEAQGAKQ